MDVAALHVASLRVTEMCDLKEVERGHKILLLLLFFVQNITKLWLLLWKSLSLQPENIKK